MKGLLAAVFAARLLASTPRLAGAHGGGLNRDGCHRETATGGYHCHRGGKSDDGKTWQAVGYVVVGLVVVWAILGATRSYRQFELPEKGLRFTPVQQDRVGAFVEWRW